MTVMDLDFGSIGIGGFLGYSSSIYEYTYFNSVWNTKFYNYLVGAMSSCQYSINEKLSIYGGASLGLNVESIKSAFSDLPGYNTNDNNITYIWSCYAGGRYYFSDKFAAMAEIGYGIAWLNLGVAVKL
jgi:hypothetical protein